MSLQPRLSGAFRLKMLMDSLSYKPVRELSALLVSRQLSARELLDACLTQIDRVNPIVNAIVTLDREGAYANADAVAAGPDIAVLVDLQLGEGSATIRTTDLSHAYVEENSAYSS